MLYAISISMSDLVHVKTRTHLSQTKQNNRRIVRRVFVQKPQDFPQF
jgi:hypothetical protein